MSILADFILLGHEKIGTQALSVSKIELFMDTIEAWLAGIADVFNQYAIPRLMRLNGISDELFPTLKFSAPRDPDIGILGDYVSKLTASGAMLPDDDLSDYLRTLAGLPTEEAEEVQ